MDPVTSPPYDATAGTRDVRVYASWGARLGAFLLDTVIVTVFAVVVTVTLLALVALAGGVSRDAVAAVGVAAWYVLAFVAPAAYFTYFHGSERGQTIGKRALGIRVRGDPSGAPIGYGRAFVRWLMPLLFSLALVIPWLLNYVWPLRDKRNQTWHDKIVGSVVLRAD